MLVINKANVLVPMRCWGFQVLCCLDALMALVFVVPRLIVFIYYMIICKFITVAIVLFLILAEHL